MRGGNAAHRLSTMRLASAVAVSFALHAATLVLARGGIGHAGRPPQPATAPLSVSLGDADAAPERLFAPGVASDERDVPATTQADAMPTPAVSAPGIVSAEYFPSDALTRLPEALTDFDTLFPQEAEPPPGRLELRLWLSRDGVIDKVEVMRTETPEALTNVALDAFRQMRFRAGEIRGTPVGSVADIVVEFAQGQPRPADAVIRQAR